MNYFSIEFLIPGPYSNFPGINPEIDELAINGEQFVESILANSGVEFLHEYSWPDGSCYKYVRSELTPEQLKKHLNLHFIPSTYSVGSVNKISENQKPYKANPSTYKEFSSLKEYFDFVGEIK